MPFEIVGEISQVETIAVGRRIRDLPRLRRLYGTGRWRKLKGVAVVRLRSGVVRGGRAPASGQSLITWAVGSPAIRITLACSRRPSAATDFGDGRLRRYPHAAGGSPLPGSAGARGDRPQDSRGGASHGQRDESPALALRRDPGS